MQSDDGIQPLEALLYTLQQVNSDKLIPGITLGIMAVDSCDNINYALDQCLDFIQGLFRVAIYRHKRTKYKFGANGCVRRETGVIGGGASRKKICRSGANF